MKLGVGILAVIAFAGCGSAANSPSASKSTTPPTHGFTVTGSGTGYAVVGAGDGANVADSHPTCKSFNGKHVTTDLTGCIDSGSIQILVWVTWRCINYTTVGWFKTGATFHYDQHYNDPHNVPHLDGYPFTLCK